MQKGFPVCCYSSITPECRAMSSIEGRQRSPPALGVNKMEALLTPVSQAKKASESEDFLRLATTSAPPSSSVPKTPPQFKGESAQEALEVLKSQPDYDTLLLVLKYFHRGAQVKPSQQFHIKSPSPLAAQLVHVLVTEIVPNYWTVLNESSSSQRRIQDVDYLLACLCSIAGINAMLFYMRALLREAKSDPKGLTQSHATFSLKYTLDLISRLLHPANVVKRLWIGAKDSTDNPSKLRSLKQELIGSVTSGKLPSLAAESEDVLKQAGRLPKAGWIADGKQYIQWLGRNIINWISAGSEDDRKLCSEFMSRSLSLAHAGMPPIDK